jgi:proteic killer suppression protein
MLELAFADKDLRELCERKSAAEAEFGTAIARCLRRRIAEVRASDNVAAILTGNARPYGRGNTAQYLVDVQGGWRLVLAANHQDPPRLQNGQIDWSRVTRVKILGIEN